MWITSRNWATRPARSGGFHEAATAVVDDGGAVVIPTYSTECHYEAELAVLIGTDGKDITEAEALSMLPVMALPSI